MKGTEMHKFMILLLQMKTHFSNGNVKSTCNCFALKAKNDYNFQKCYNHFTSGKTQDRISISWLFGKLKDLHLHQFKSICNCSTYHEYPFCAFVLFST